MENTTDSQPLPLFYHALLERYQLAMPYSARVLSSTDIIQSINQKEQQIKALYQQHQEELTWLSTREKQLKESITEYQEQSKTNQQNDQLEQTLQSLETELHKTRSKISSIEASLQHELTKEDLHQRQQAQEFLNLYLKDNRSFTPSLPEVEFNLTHYTNARSNLDTFHIDDFYYHVDAQLVLPEHHHQAPTKTITPHLAALVLEYFQMMKHPETTLLYAWEHPLLDLHRDFYGLIRTYATPGSPVISPLLGIIQHTKEPTVSGFPSSTDPEFYLCQGNYLYTHELIPKTYRKIR